MALEVEDGTGKDDAQTYVTAEEARDFALLRGETLSATDSVVEVLLVKAMDWLEGQDWKGTPTSETQALAWPREDVDGYDNNEIPTKLKNAQCQLVLEALVYDLAPSGDGKQVIKEKVDVIETEYAPASTSAPIPAFPKVEAWIKTLIGNPGGIGLLRTVRI